MTREALIKGIEPKTKRQKEKLLPKKSVGYTQATLGKVKVATLNKHRKKWQAIVRKKKITVIKSFWKKGDARKWADKIEAQIEV